MNRKRTGTTRTGLAAVAVLLSLSLATAAGAQESPPPDQDLPVLTLGQCVSIALEASPTLQITEEQEHVAGQNVKEATGAFLPGINLSRTFQKSERTDFDVEQTSPGVIPIGTQGGDVVLFPASIPNGTYANETINSKYADWAGGADLNIFRGLAKFSNLSAAKRYREAAGATRDYTRELVVQDVVTRYFDLLRTERLLEVAIETRDQVAKELEKTETYFRLGSAAKSDVLQQRVQLENARLDVVVADNNVKYAFTDLAFAMNRPLASAFRIDASVLETDYYIEDVNSLYQEALAARLDLVSNERTVEARHKEVTTATSNIWPSLDLFVNYSRYNNESPYRFGSQESQNTSFGYRINWNVFDRMQTWTGRSKAKAQARIAEYELDQARLNVQVEIRQLHNAMVEAKERANVSRETIIQSEEELRLAQERFRVGAGTTLDIIVAQANLANSRSQEVQAMCDFLIARARLHRAVGRLSPWTRMAQDG